MACIDQKIRKNIVASVLPNYWKSTKTTKTTKKICRISACAKKVSCRDWEGMECACKSILGIKCYLYSQLKNAYKLYTTVWRCSQFYILMETIEQKVMHFLLLLVMACLALVCSLLQCVRWRGSRWREKWTSSRPSRLWGRRDLTWSTTR